jgi:hypothetical protein
MQEARDDLVRLRGSIREVASKHGDSRPLRRRHTRSAAGETRNTPTKSATSNSRSRCRVRHGDC